MFAYIANYSNRKLKKPDMLTRKSFCIALALVLISGLVGLPRAAIRAGCAGACCMESKIQAPQHAAAGKGLSQPRGCCCGTKATPCDVSQGCASELPDFAIFAVPMVEREAYEDSSVIGHKNPGNSNCGNGLS